jgi:peptidyl-prolyl cis-trans isomerase SurA
MRTYFRAVAGLIILSALLPLTAQAQVNLIAATVNNKVISTQDLHNRVKLAMISAGLPDNPQVRKEMETQVLKMLIDEHIQLQLGQDFSIKIDEASLNAAIRDIENQNNMPEGGLKKMLVSHGIPFSVMKTHLEASIIWREYIRERYRNLVQVSDEEVQRSLAERSANKKEARYALGEIVLYFNGKEDVTSTKAQADRIVTQVKKGAQFSMLAAQFSNAPSASRGGDIGWVPHSKLENAAVLVLSDLTPGQVSSPVKTGRGYHIYFLRDKLASGELEKVQTTLTFKQIFIPISSDAFEFEVNTAMRQAQSLARQITNCRVVEQLVTRKDAKIQTVKDVPLESLPPELRTLMEKAGENKATPPVFTGSGAMLFVMCEKKTSNPKEPSEEEVRSYLVDQKLQNVSEQELRTRRSSAHIESRL